MFDRGGLAHVFTGDPAPPEYQDRGWFVEGPEQRANRWAADLLMPKAFFVPDAAGRPITFATVWSLARRYRTSVTATALRLVDYGSYPAMIVCSRPVNRWRFFHQGAGVGRDFWPRDQPGPQTVAHKLLLGWGRRPGPTDVPSDGWFERKDAWWYMIREDSVEVGNGEVLSLLWWKEPGQIKASQMAGGTWLPWAPGQNARRRLIKTLREKWGYRRVRGAKGEAVLVTEEPSHQRLVIADHRSLDEKTLRGLVAAVAEHKGVGRDAVLLSMLVEPKLVAEARAEGREVRPHVEELPPWRWE